MKLQNQNLAERLAAAAATPLPLPPAAAVASPVPVPNEAVLATLRGRPRIETVQMTIRPSRSLRERLDQIAIQRAVSEARIVTAQEIAIEILEGAVRADWENA